MSKMSFVDKVILDREGLGAHVHKMRAVDSKNGRNALYYVLVPPTKRADFEKQVSSTKVRGSMNIENYGKIIASCYGYEPDERVKRILEEEYSFNL